MTAAIRLVLGSLLATELIIGAWAQYFPASFYRDFPTVDLTPPYSEHLLRDFGGATLGLAVVIGAAVIWPQTKLVIIASCAYLIFAVPHLVFHLEHLETATAVQVVLLVGELVVATALAVLAIVLAVVRMRRDTALRDPAVG
jgi:hypothetical protein